MMTAQERFDYWQRPDVKRAQFEASLFELQHWRDFDVYRVFVDVGKRLVSNGWFHLSDVGPGVGQYALLWLGPCGGGTYVTQEETDDAYFDDMYAHLYSACLEYAEDPLAEVAKVKQTSIFHRLRFQSGTGCFIEEPSYCGVSVPMWRWNRDELTNAIGNRKITRHAWPNEPAQETWVIE